MASDVLNEAYFQRGFKALEDELAGVMTSLSEALPEGASEVAGALWKEEQGPAGNAADAATVAQVSSVAFELLNIVEERVAWRFRNIRRSEHGTGTIRGLWPAVVKRMHRSGLSEDEAIAALKKVEVEPVLTAHPTEAKRPIVREKHLAIYRRLADLEESRTDPHREGRVRFSFRAELEGLWHTGEIFIKRPTIADERRNALYYLREVFPGVVLRLDQSLSLAWKECGWDPERLRAEEAFPKIRFASWIGGDRDGHPYVTAEVTQRTFKEMKDQALRLHRDWLRKSAESLTQSVPFVKASEELEIAITKVVQELGPEGDEIARRNEQERWRCWFYLLREKLARTMSGGPGGYLAAEEYEADLQLAKRSLIEVGAPLAVQEWVNPLLRLQQVFGFHLAALDVRNNSASHDQAMADLLEAVGIEDGAQFADWPEERRVQFLDEELKSRRPLLARGEVLPGKAAEVIGYLRVVAEQGKKEGSKGLGQLIISMTRQVSDLLVMQVFARESGLATWEDGRWHSRLPVSPLFETGDDLAAAEGILAKYLDITEGAGQTMQPAMVGYSDSNKDAGVFASQWGIHRGQQAMAEACSQRGLPTQFFHGRGGTIGRGAGPTQWFLKALPPGSLTGPVRLTEQGEVLPRKYAHEGNAHYHLELLMAGVSEAVALQGVKKGVPEDLRETLNSLSDTSADAYRELFTSEGFLEFHRAATPIDALETGVFGSRPARRTGKPSLKDLRAIPWVFSWTQSRFYLPGWFGVGKGLERLKDESPAGYERMKEVFNEVSFLRYVFTNVETSLASANLELMAAYGSLCENEELRQRVLGIIEEEFARTRAQIGEFLGGDFASRRPRMNKTLALRELPLRRLHEQQIALLRDWRAADRPVGESDNFDSTFLALQMTVNAISSGLRETG
ncbi:MAG: phosphoenolpyruvate carboxylase [Verrucomicrobiota bacterium JB023]|nr:phosphoenolpyruvate carboxylase [Verrucomicrobiota bacterium JB023]